MDTSKADRFGLLNVVDYLAGGNVLNWEAVTRLENTVVHVKLMRDGVLAWAEYRYLESIKTRQ